MTDNQNIQRAELLETFGESLLELFPVTQVGLKGNGPLPRGLAQLSRCRHDPRRGANNGYFRAKLKQGFGHNRDTQIKIGRESAALARFNQDNSW